MIFIYLWLFNKAAKYGYISHFLLSSTAHFLDNTYLYGILEANIGISNCQYTTNGIGNVEGISVLLIWGSRSLSLCVIP